MGVLDPQGCASAGRLFSFLSACGLSLGRQVSSITPALLACCMVLLQAQAMDQNLQIRSQN